MRQLRLDLKFDNSKPDIRWGDFWCLNFESDERKNERLYYLDQWIFRNQGKGIDLHYFQSHLSTSLTDLINPDKSINKLVLGRYVNKFYKYRSKLMCLHSVATGLCQGTYILYFTNGHYYVGKTDEQTFSIRWKQHLNNLQNNHSAYHGLFKKSFDECGQFIPMIIDWSINGKRNHSPSEDFLIHITSNKNLNKRIPKWHQN